MKKHLLLLLVALLPVVANAYDAYIGGIYYNFSGDEATVTYKDYSYNSYSGAVVIPKSVTYSGKTYSVTSIGDAAFYECSGLTSVTIPNSVTSIGEIAFWYCTSLTSITIPGSVTSIGDYAFFQCSSLTSVTIPNSVTSIGREVFYNCSSLTSVTIPNSVTSIGVSAFYGCRNLTSVTIGNSVTSIGDGAFRYCTSLTSITIPNSVTSIGNNAFYNCSGLTSVTIGNGVTSIGDGAFSGCSSLTSITIPGGVKSIGEYAFTYCCGLTSIKVDTGNQYYDSRGNCNAIIETASNTLITGCMNTIIPNSVTSIGEYAFSGCSSLTSIIIGNSVTSIGDGAFYNCSSLTSVTIPNSVTSIGEAAFYNCSSLTSVTIGNSVTSIGYGAFRYCTSLTSITIPNSVTRIGEDAFAYCSGLTEVYCLAENVPETSSKAFDGSPIASATLHVPASSVNAYKTTAPWSNFGQIVAINAIKETCTIPTISYANGKLTFNCETEDVIFHSTITDTDITSYLTQEVELCVTYTISVYATKEDYEDSEVATGTLCWIDQQPNTEGIVAEDAVTEVKALPVLIQSNGGTITVQGANEGTEIMVYSVNGMKQGSAIATNGLASINISLQPGATAIVKIGEKAIKVLIK